MQLRTVANLPIIEVFMTAPSPRQAYYQLWIEKAGNTFRVFKESGIGFGATPMHRQTLYFETLEDALEIFKKRIYRKTNRKKGRIYNIQYYRCQKPIELQ